MSVPLDAPTVRERTLHCRTTFSQIWRDRACRCVNTQIIPAANRVLKRYDLMFPLHDSYEFWIWPSFLAE